MLRMMKKKRSGGVERMYEQEYQSGTSRMSKNWFLQHKNIHRLSVKTGQHGGFGLAGSSREKSIKFP